MGRLVIENSLYVTTVGCLPSQARGRIKFFLTCLKEACILSPPPYGESGYNETYQSLAQDANWLSNLLVKYSREEAIASKRLRSFRARSRWILSKPCRQLLRRHQADEELHVLEFLKLSESVFPTKNVAILKEHLRKERHVTPFRVRPISSDGLLKEIAQINIGEVKNRIHLELLKDAALHHCSINRRLEVARIADGLIRDEVNHIYYSAFVIEGLPTHQRPRLRETYKREFVAFNVKLRTELERCSLEC